MWVVLVLVSLLRCRCWGVVGCRLLVVGAVVANVTAANPSAAGFATVYPCGVASGGVVVELFAGSDDGDGE